METSKFLDKSVFGIKIYEYLLVLSFYFFFAFSYHLTLWVNSMYKNPPVSDLFNFIIFIDAAGLDYLIKLLLTIPIWWFIFRKLKHWPLKYRVPVHLLGLPIFVVLFQQLYYLVSEQLGFYHLGSYGQVWDIYIPGLFYCIQFGIFHTYQYYHENQRNIKAQAVLSEAALKSELSALKAQLNPHFLYNVFNTISASVPPEQEQTRELIAKLSDLFRYQLKASKLDLVPLREELEFVKKYLDLEKARFENRLQVHIDVPSELLETPIPPMILQPLVENSVKHGLSSLVEGGEINIQVQNKANKIVFEVKDTGVGVQDKSKLFGVGVGLTNTKLRLEKQYGTELKISDNIPQGLKVEFAI